MKDKKPVYVAVDKKDKLFYYDGEKYIPVDEPSTEEITEIAKDAVETAEEGTLDKVLGLDAEGNLKKGSVSGGTKLYLHEIMFKKVNGSDDIDFKFISLESEPCDVERLYFYGLVSGKTCGYNQSGQPIWNVGGLITAPNNWKMGASPTSGFRVESQIDFGIPFPGSSSVNLYQHQKDTINLETGEVERSAATTLSYESWEDMVTAL